MEIRAIEDDEIPAYREAMFHTFGDDAADTDPDGATRMRALIEPARAWAAFDAGAIVATAATLTLHVVVPGGATLPMAGLTQVTVRPTHRRRGILRELMRHHFNDARTRNEPISGLWASESSIYGRFGYGIAAEADEITIDHAHSLEIAFHAPLDAIEWCDLDRARELLPAIYARATAARPGAILRTAVWWREKSFHEAAFVRRGASRRRTVVARRGEELVGYAMFRQRGGFTDTLPSGAIEIVELLGVDGRAEASLWRWITQVDLFPKVTWWNAPTDDVLPWIARDGRRVARRRTDNLWIRIDDVARALEARSYPADGALCLGVDGTACELVVEHGRGHHAVATREPELRLSRASLGALYFGGVTASRLFRAGQLHGSASAIATADRVFASAIAPWCPEMF
jgi:predicted acetyltransferase